MGAVAALVSLHATGGRDPWTSAAAAAGIATAAAAGIAFWKAVQDGQRRGIATIRCAPVPSASSSSMASETPPQAPVQAHVGEVQYSRASGSLLLSGGVEASSIVPLQVRNLQTQQDLQPAPIERSSADKPKQEVKTYD